MTETELVMASLTQEELTDALKWLAWMRDQWATLDPRARLQAGFDTDGPWHVHQAMALAIVREQVARGGGQVWFAGESVDDHPERSALRYYQDRVSLSEGVLDKPRLADTGVLTRQCGLCGLTRPATALWWTREGGTWALHCRPCSDPSWTEELRAADARDDAITRAL